MRHALASLLLLGLASTARSDVVQVPEPTPTAEELAQAAEELDELEKTEPRGCRQSCSTRPCSPTHLSPYFFPRAEMRITSTTYARLRTIRSAMLQRIGERLLPALRSSVALEARIVGGEHYIAAHHEHLLAILIDLNAVEALPLLLDALAESERLDMPFAALQVLSAITGILRQEGYRPLLESELERRYGEALTAFWRERLEQDPAAMAWAREHGTIDPAHGVPPVHARPVVLIELTPALRAQVEAWARDFLATTPVDERKGAAAMLAKPATR